MEWMGEAFGMLGRVGHKRCMAEKQASKQASKHSMDSDE